MAAAMPLPQARGDFLKRVRAFCQDLYKIGSPEVRAATFIFENTICYQEFETAKRLTLDEFVNGRKRSNGERLGPGCGFKDRANASKALTNLEKRGFIAVESDPHDAARKKKFYRLTLPSLNRCCQSDNTCEQDTAILPSNVVEMTTRCSQIDNTMLSEQQQSVVESTTRTGEERGEVLREVAKESTLYVAGATVDDVVSVEIAEEEDTPMSPVAPVTPDDDYPFKPLTLPSKSDRLRSKLHKERQQPTLLEVSDSQEQDSEPRRVRLSEEAASETTGGTTTPESEELRYYRELLLKQQRQLKDEQDYLGLCEEQDKPQIEANIEMYRAAVASTEQIILDLQPAPALDDSNWQSQLFGGLCRLAGASPERISGTPLAKTLGQAAAKIKAHKRRPDELQHMWQRFRTDARFRWMNGRGDTGKLMMLFAQNAAVL